MLSRRRFVAGIASGLSLGGLSWPFALSAASAQSALSDAQRRWLLAVIPEEDRRYDPFAKMLVRSAASGPGHLRALKTGDVHATRPSLVYAAALLDTGEDWRVDRAREILRVVTGLQDKEPAHPTYGLWPWCLEEPPANLSPSDSSMAGSCALPLLMAWMGHRERLGKELAAQARESVIHAAHSIQRRDLNFAETSAAITDTSVALLAAQEFKLDALRGYAKRRLRELHDQVVRQGSFGEYNSPSHGILTLQELSRMLWLVKDGRDRTRIAPLHDLAWRHVATHFHAPTHQWAGPHSRADETDLRRQPATLAFLQTACGRQVNFNLPAPLPLNLEAHRLPLQCPRRWVRHFAQLDAPRQVVETFVKADPAKPGAKNAVIGTTWLHPQFTIGSVNRGDFWKERRPLLAYWGTTSAPRYLRVRFLKDDDDFASALLFTVQHESSVLAVVTFATDHGDTHPSLGPMQDGTIRAKNLRLRFEFGGDLSAFTARAIDEGGMHFVLQDRDVRLMVRPVADGFGAARFAWDSPELRMTDRIDAVVGTGEAGAIRLPSLGEAFLCFTLEEWPYGQRRAPAAAIEVQRADGRLQARWATRGKTLALEAAIRPGAFAGMNDAFRSAVS
jgi:hypothetical protein